MIGVGLAAIVTMAAGPPPGTGRFPARVVPTPPASRLQTDHGDGDRHREGATADAWDAKLVREGYEKEVAAVKRRLTGGRHV